MSKIFYFVPAPDMDERSIEAVKLNGFEVIPVMLPPIDSNTELYAYIKQLSKQIRHDRPVLVGGCYGAALALELSRVVDVERVVVVACIKDQSELTFLWRVIYNFFLMLPPWFQKGLGVSATILVNKILRVPVKIPRIWRKSAQNKFIARHLLSLAINPRPAKIVHIHGTDDKIFPIRKIKDVDIVLTGGHFMLDKNRRATLAAIESAVLLE